jgi:hypothetical protein
VSRSEVDPVEAALAAALTAATAAGQWEVARELARELEARRKATNAGNLGLTAQGRAEGEP